MAVINDLIPSPQQLQIATGLDVDRVEFLAGDASDRTYHRVFLKKPHNGKSTLVLMLLSKDEQPKLEQNNYDWVHIQRLLEENQIPVPGLAFALPESGCLLIEDYGDQMLETPALANTDQSEHLLELYEPCLHLCGKLLEIEKSDSVWTSRAFDQDRFEWELQFYKKYYIKRFCKMEFEREKERELDRKFKALAKELGEHANWFVHRDLHSRNIMSNNGNTALIDFQDARLGPAAYDLVSLCFDSYIPMRWETRQTLLETGIARIEKTSGLAANEIKETWKKVFLQRQLKVLGSFAYLKLVKEKPQYEKYIDPVKEMIAHAGFGNEWFGDSAK